MHVGVTVTYSVCIGGAGIDYSSVASILYTYSAFSSSCGFTPVGWGYAGPALGLGLPRCQLRVSDIAVTDSARFCGGGFDSFLGFEYVVLITLALPVFEYFLHFLLRACVLYAFWLRWGSPNVTPTACLPSHLLTCGPFIRFVGFFPVSQGFSCVGVVRHDNYSADSSTSLAQCGFVGGFLPNFAIFALVSVHLGKFGLSSLASIGNSNAFLCQLSLPILLSLSPLVMQFMNSVSQPIMAATN